MHEPLTGPGAGNPPERAGLGAVASARSPRLLASRSRRRVAGAALGAGLGALVALGGAPAATAADDCPNAAVRAQHSATHLPNCLAYEQVTPADKNGAGASPNFAIAENGNALLFTMNSGMPDNQGLIFGMNRANRGPNGWLATAMTPGFPDRPPLFVDSLSFVAASSDLDRVALITRYPVDPKDAGTVGPPSHNGSEDVYIREPDGSFTWVHPNPAGGDTAGNAVAVHGASPGLKRMVVSTARPFDPRVTTTNVPHVYVWTRSGTHLASVLPDGTLPTALPTAGGSGVSSVWDARTGGVSADGRRVAFTVGTGASSRVYVRFNADDPATAVTREVAVGPNGEACAATSNGTRVVALSADGTKLLFGCTNAILPGAPTQALYMRDLDGGPGAVELIVAVTSMGARIFGANPDFSRVYLNGIGSTGDALHLLRDGAPELIAPVVAGDLMEASWESGVGASPNGEYFVFQSPGEFGLPGVDAGAAGNSTTGDSQVYRYAAQTREFTCLSCRQDGSPTDGKGGLGDTIPWVATSQVSAVPLVGDNGAVAFSSTVALDPADTNGVQDAYAWIDGNQVLLSSGRGADPSVTRGTVMGGTGFVVVTPDALVPDDRDGGTYDVYMARAGGGFLLPDPAVECTTNCQGPGPGQPSLPGVGSSVFAGHGNLVEEATAPAKRATASLSASRSVRGTRTTVRVRVSRAGSIRVSGKGLRRRTVRASKAGIYRVTVRLSAYGTKQRRTRGRMATRITARLTPESGSPVKARRSVTFRAAKKGGR